MLNEIDLSRADLNLLVLFEAVLAERHVGRAAARLNLTASAVSHGLGRLRRLLNDPLFLRTPKGVVPTARAAELAEPIAEILARIRGVVARGEPFDAATSTRRFTISTPDAAAAVFLPRLLAALPKLAPGIDIAIRQLLPPPRRLSWDRPWEAALVELEARETDIGVVPLEEVPPRFAARALWAEEFVVAMRPGHPFAEEPTLDRYCALPHLLVSLTGDAHGFVDQALVALGRTRRIALTVPNFMMALTLTRTTDLLATLPRSLLAGDVEPTGLVSVPAPLPLPCFTLNAIASKAALMDAGIAWLFDLLAECSRVEARA